MTDGPARPNMLEVASALDEEAGQTPSLFDTAIASAYSCYAGILRPETHPDGAHPQFDSQRAGRLYTIPAGQLWPDEHGRRVPPLAQTAHDMFRSHVLGDNFPCLGARAAFHQGTYRFGFYKEMAHLGSLAPMGRDLRRFVQEYKQLGDFATFVATFQKPQSTSEEEFEDLLWRHLQMLHEHDGTGWDPHYGADPGQPNFAFSFAGEAFFVVGIHSGASRYSRIGARPTLVFNPESQIRRLKEQGALPAFTEKIRRRDIAYQGDTNPSIPTEEGTTGGEARVYSGKRHVEGDEWKCPFRPRPEVVAKSRCPHKP